MTYLKLETLARLDACREYRERFEHFFGEGVEVTVELCETHARDFDWEWASDNLLTTDQRTEYWETIRPALDKCKAEFSPALTKMNRVTDEAYEVYNKACRGADIETVRKANEEYNKATDAASEEYNKIRNEAWGAYYVACAKTFGELFCKGE